MVVDDRHMQSVLYVFPLADGGSMSDRRRRCV